jgi:hypothetical protein
MMIMAKISRMARMIDITWTLKTEEMSNTIPSGAQKADNGWEPQGEGGGGADAGRQRF